MEPILVLLHTEGDGALHKASLEALSVARALGCAFDVGLVGGNVNPALAQIAGCGARRVLALDGADFAVSRYSTDCPAAVALFQETLPAVVIAPCTARWQRSLPGAAARMGGAADTHLTGVALVDGEVEVSRWFYRQRIEATFRREQRPWFLLVEGGIRAPYSAQGYAPAIERLTLSVKPRTEVTGMIAPQGSTQTIRPEAELLLVAGAGWTKKQKDGAIHIEQAGKLILDLLANTNASLGSSKSLVDLSGEGHAVLPFLSHLNQVGQTGSTPRHPKGLATCCHGEEPHAVGWRFVQDRRAVNLDANCGWARGKADVVYVADAFAVMERLNALLAKR
ncbi:MAG: electron transfer flavoprotein subunit alpha [Bryobacterales bacterium]|jgi:electron transfer flavoprotein alpha subunit|nr:electron transfer flavoprotein subunit alpha [Bryobacterales bacterium]